MSSHLVFKRFFIQKRLVKGFCEKLDGSQERPAYKNKPFKTLCFARPIAAKQTRNQRAVVLKSHEPTSCFNSSRNYAIITIAWQMCMEYGKGCFGKDSGGYKKAERTKNSFFL